ncbi:Bbp16 family capsid cement protein [Bordetella avium]|uniref:Bbp16 family capsid cement protein n=1 Tax=Bordetella avium TaxID=521 RepID=UPI000FD7404E|nr:hypothetical protein [Bordetella avium]AZY52828.1 hypothetical protein C0J07_10200 [Bordetella avium]
MILDKLNEFADATAIPTATTGLALVGNVIDLQDIGRDVGTGEPLYLVIEVDTAVQSGGAATVSFVLASDAQAAIATDGSATQHYASAAYPKATLVAGFKAAVVALPAGTYERYLGILADVGTAAVTAGKVNAFLTHDVSNWRAYPSA